MESLMNISAIGFWVCVGMTVIGLLATVYIYRKFDIRSIYMIRSGKAQRKSVSELQARNSETGRLSADMTEGSSPKRGSFRTGGKTFGKRSGKTEKTEDASPFQRKTHSGNTGAFKSAVPQTVPGADTMPHQAPDPPQPAQETMPDTTVLDGAAQEQMPDTTVLAGNAKQNRYATTQLSRSDIEAALANQSYGTDAGSRGTYEPAAYTEPRAQLDIISRELIIHTDEVIDL